MEIMIIDDDNMNNISTNYFNNTDHNYGCYSSDIEFAVYVVTLIIICIGLPLTLVAIVAVYSLVRKDHVAPIYIINLLISDLIQLCCMIVEVADCKFPKTVVYSYSYGVAASVGFMVCISLERYVVIAWPLWYRFRRTIKIPVVVCVVVWALPLVYILLIYFWVDIHIIRLTLALYLLLPFPLFIFFLGGTLKALSASLSVPSDEKRRIVGVLVVVLLIYTLLFLPTVIWSLAEETRNNVIFLNLPFLLLKLSPLADLTLYIFMRKGAIDNILMSLCCCRIENNQQMSVSCRQEI